MGMIRSLGEVCRELREEKRLNRTAIGYHIGYQQGGSDGAIGKFERGETQHRDLDALIDAYAKETGVSALTIWRRALERYEAGNPARFERELKAGSRSRRKGSGSTAKDAASKPTRKAARGAASRSRS